MRFRSSRSTLIQNAFLSILLIFIAISLRAQAPGGKQQIYELLQKGQFAEAEHGARIWLHAVPADCTVRTMLGLALRGEAKETDAFAEFQASLQTCPKLVAALEGAAEIAYKKRMPQAENLLQRLLELQPENPVTHEMLGALNASSGNCAASVEQYGLVESAIQKNIPALRQYVGCLIVLGQEEKALAPLAQLTQLSHDPRDRIALAQMQLNLGRFRDAETAIQPQLDSQTNDSRALLLAAQIEERNNETEQAIEHLRRAIALDPQFVNAYLYIAEICFAHGSFQVGTDFLELGLKRQPRNAKLLLALGVFKVQGDNMDEALKDFEEAYRIDPQLSVAQDAVGVLLTQKHDSSRALDLFERRSKEQPQDPLLHYLYAEALSESAPDEGGKLDRAIAEARQAVNLEANYLAAHDLLARLLMDKGDADEALTEAQKAIHLDANDEAALYQAMMAQRKLKHADQAKQFAQQLQQAKAHNRQSLTNYMLSEQPPATGINQPQ